MLSTKLFRFITQNVLPALIIADSFSAKLTCPSHTASRASMTIFLFPEKEYSRWQTCVKCPVHTSESRKIFPITGRKAL